MKLILIQGLAGLALAVTAVAEPFQLAVWNPVQIRPASESIEGVRLNLFYGRNADLLGLDYGLVNQLDGTCTGWQGGMANLVAGDFTGIQDACLYAQVGGDLTGIQSGFVTRNGSLTGIELGCVNLAGPVQGIQLGLYNDCASLQGLQLGLLNRDRSNARLPYLPLVRWSK